MINKLKKLSARIQDSITARKELKISRQNNARLLSIHFGEVGLPARVRGIDRVYFSHAVKPFVSEVLK